MHTTVSCSIVSFRFVEVVILMTPCAPSNEHFFKMVIYPFNGVGYRTYLITNNYHQIFQSHYQIWILFLESDFVSLTYYYRFHWHFCYVCRASVIWSLTCSVVAKVWWPFRLQARMMMTSLCVWRPGTWDRGWEASWGTADPAGKGHSQCGFLYFRPPFLLYVWLSIVNLVEQHQDK